MGESKRAENQSLTELTACKLQGADPLPNPLLTVADRLNVLRAAGCSAAKGAGTVAARISGKKRGSRLAPLLCITPRLRCTTVGSLSCSASRPCSCLLPLGRSPLTRYAARPVASFGRGLVRALEAHLVPLEERAAFVEPLNDRAQRGALAPLTGSRHPVPSRWSLPPSPAATLLAAWRSQSLQSSGATSGRSVLSTSAVMCGSVGFRR